MKVTYTGTADVQKFGKADFTKAGVEHDGVTFKRGVPTEVSDQLGAVLISKDPKENPIFASYKFEEADEPEAAEKPTGEKPKQKSSSGSSQQQDATPGSTGNTGAGTSTS